MGWSLIDFTADLTARTSDASSTPALLLILSKQKIFRYFMHMRAKTISGFYRSWMRACRRRRIDCIPSTSVWQYATLGVRAYANLHENIHWGTTLYHSIREWAVKRSAAEECRSQSYCKNWVLWIFMHARILSIDVFLAELSTVARVLL